MPPSRSHPPNLSKRKLDHLRAIEDDSVDLGRDSFSRYRLLYNALPELSLADISTECEFAGRRIAAPLLISCMTGGAGEPFVSINRRLAEGAERLRLPLGLGSMKVLLRDEAAFESFAVRKHAPSIPIIANLGLVSFNYGLNLDDVKRLIERLNPDVFAFHLNALQEIVQDGGDTDFRGLHGKLRNLVHGAGLPVYVKECGGGIRPRLVEELVEMGVTYVDLAGADGTSWSAVEANLSHDPLFGEAFRDFGLPTAWILKNLPAGLLRKGRLVASGGIRNGVQAVKALALGADYVAIARPFVLAAQESTGAVVALGERLIRQMRSAMLLVGAAKLADLSPDLVFEQTPGQP